MEPNREPIRIELELEREAEPIRGALLVGGTRREFAGWVELASALELARRRPVVPLGAAAERGGDT